MSPKITHTDILTHPCLHAKVEVASMKDNWGTWGRGQRGFSGWESLSKRSLVLLELLPCTYDLSKMLSYCRLKSCYKLRKVDSLCFFLCFPFVYRKKYVFTNESYLYM